MLVAFRLSFAILALLFAFFIARPNLPEGQRMWLILFIFGFFNVGIPYYLISWGEQYIDSAEAAILNSSTPLFAMVIAHFALTDDRITFPKIIGLVTGFFGIVILVSRDLGSLLVKDFKQAHDYFRKHPLQSHLTREEATGFHH